MRDSPSLIGCQNAKKSYPRYRTGKTTLSNKPHPLFNPPLEKEEAKNETFKVFKTSEVSKNLRGLVGIIERIVRLVLGSGVEAGAVP